MANNPRQPLNYKQIAAKLKITEKEEKRALTEALLRMKKDGMPMSVATANTYLRPSAAMSPAQLTSPNSVTPS
jgi:hypothetical protein